MTDLAIFEDKKVRRVEYNGEWYFSVVDVVAILTESSVAKRKNPALI
jgi:prophage antirepressor-like protein